MISLRQAALTDSLSRRAAPRVSLRWLGQAGFDICGAGARIIVDPYLSDYLAHKYAGKRYAHVRMTPAPESAGSLRDVDAVLCTHAHSDHMDPETLPVIARVNPGCRFVLPRSAFDTAVVRGVPASRIVAINAGESVTVARHARVTALPSAHETIEIDGAGQHRFLGYLIELGGATIYHSGDCVPYDGLPESLAAQPIDVALLPVNGRDAQRTGSGILGNFTFEEAVALCTAARIPWLVPHHFGMFDFNTVDESELRRKALDRGDVSCMIPDIAAMIAIEPAVIAAERSV